MNIMNIQFLHMQSFLSNLCFLVSFFTTIYYWTKVIFFSKTSTTFLGFWGFCILNVGIAIQLVFRWVESGHFPLSSLYESLLFLSWSFTLIYLVVENFLKTEFIGVVISPLILCVLGFTGFSLPTDLQLSKPLVPALQSNWLFMHVSVMMLSYAGLLIGSLVAFSYLIISRVSNSKGEDAVSQTEVLSVPIPLASNFLTVSPSTFASQTGEPFETSSQKENLLSILDNLSYRTIGIGFCFLTLGILSGAVWANETWGTYWSWDPKETWALITWLTFACYLHTRLIYGWQGVKPAAIASFGFILVWVCYLGVNLLGKGLHTYGFFSMIYLLQNYL
uniref:Cytochrome c biogenesis protein CcsA n=1 Tax=Marvania geminata TaxID=97105 RepID=A0A097KR30_9CHLO|nr:heme attachment to plastid cytochrome c [Marvania geminata]AIT95645.1 heme attachment to plastid cytochrome c [Marvania geminata]